MLMGMTIIDLPSPRREELFVWITERRVRQEVEDGEKWMILTPVTDQSRPMEADIVPYLAFSGFYAFVRMVFRLFRNAMMSAVLYGPSVA